MANRMGGFQAPSSENLRRVFEAGVRMGKSSRAIRDLRYRTPIVQRESAAGTEKRALSDAARALAQLWNVAPNVAR